MNLTNLPVIILVEPQLAVNVGMIARVMLNFNFTELRLINPRDKDVIKNAIAPSAGADLVLNNIKIFDKISDAVSDLNLIYATTKRSRYLNKPVSNLSSAFNLEYTASRIGFLFGKESNGLSNDDLNYANILININTNSQFSSLNIVQAVALVCYEWDKIYQLPNKDVVSVPKPNVSDIADYRDLEYFFNFVEKSLSTNKNLVKDKLPNIIRNFRNIFLRTELTKREVRTLYRIVKELQNSC